MNGDLTRPATSEASIIDIREPLTEINDNAIAD